MSSKQGNDKVKQSSKSNKAVKIVTKAKPTKAGNKPQSKKAPVDDSAKYAAAIKKLNTDLMDDDNIMTKSFSEKLGSALSLYINNGLDQIKKTAKYDKDFVDNYPSDVYTTLDEREQPKSKRQPNKTSVTPQHKKRLPKKRSEIIADELNKANNSHQSDQNEDDQQDQDDDQDNTNLDDTAVNSNQEDDEKEDKEESTKKTKRAMVTIQGTAKTALLFIVNRFLFEIYELSGDEHVATMDEFNKFAMENLTGMFSTHMTRVIISSNSRMNKIVSSIDTYKLKEHLDININFMFGERSNVLPHIKQHIITYIKSLGLVISKMLWVKKLSVGMQTIEQAMRILDIQAVQYYTDNNLYKIGNRSTGTYGLECGLISLMHTFNDIIHPAPTEEEKKKRALPGKKSLGKTKKQVSDEQDDQDDDQEEDIIQLEGDDDDEDNQIEEIKPKKTPNKKQPAKVPVKADSDEEDDQDENEEVEEDDGQDDEEAESDEDEQEVKKIKPVVRMVKKNNK